MEHRIKAKNIKEVVLEQEAEQLAEVGMVDYLGSQDYKHLTGHHIVLYGAVGNELHES